MKKNVDPRVNARNFPFGKYVELFLVILLICGFYGWILSKQLSEDLNEIWITVSMAAYLLVVSGLLTAVFAYTRRKYVHQPLRRLSDAARQVAGGDFSVRLAPQRKDGKIDEYEALYQDFNTMAAELGSTEMLKNDFISNVSHELKTPIAVIQTYATMLQNRDLSEAEREEYAGVIFETSRRLSTLVGNILMLSRLENQKIHLQKHRYNLSEQLSRCALGFETVWDEKEMELEARLDQNLTVEADEGLLDIVWNNLLSNALKFTEPGGTVTLSAKRKGETAVVTVRDSGCGMDETTRRHCFDKFYQGDSSHKTAGNGLGLAMVWEILHLAGGEISVDSIPGKGTAFQVTLACGSGVQAYGAEEKEKISS